MGIRIDFQPKMIYLLYQQLNKQKSYEHIKKRFTIIIIQNQKLNRDLKTEMEKNTLY